MLASLFFYGWWNPVYLGLLIASLVVNFGLGRRLSPGSGGGRRARRVLLAASIASNLCLLGYFKYANFVVDSVNALVDTHWSMGAIVLPLAISFYTFQQIAYLVDVYRGEAHEYSFLHYALFVTFFPQLIAGPIVHHKEMLPQFARPETFRFDQGNLAVGSTLFAIGLFKKVVLADSVAAYATPVFAAAAEGTRLSFFEAWGAALAYSLQLYFDFSGYSDMALGLARLFGIVLPLNFFSPYKAVNIVDFWRRWHITLSRFLRDYVYIALGGNRQGAARRYANLMITMLLGGLWHGAGWTFVIWGGIHGILLVVNHAWHALRRWIGWQQGAMGWFGPAAARVLTFLAVTLAWVPFRAEDLTTSGSMLASLFGVNGIGLPAGLESVVLHAAPWSVGLLGLDFAGTFPHDLAPWGRGLPWIAGLLAVALLAPNSAQLMRRFRPALLPRGLDVDDGAWRWPVWRPSPLHASLAAVLLVWSLSWMTSVSEFLYFQF